ncbi:MAG: hypothetical protein U0528_04440 [Anaerolineae bacterium]
MASDGGMALYVKRYSASGTLEQFYLSVQAQTTTDLSDLFCQRRRRLLNCFR